MGVNQKKIAVHDLEIGMYVSDLDRSWHQTPFPIQGFFIRTQDDIRAVASHCKWVMVDVAEVRDIAEYARERTNLFARRLNRKNDQEVIVLPPLSIKNVVSYPPTTTRKKELRMSETLLADAEATLVSVTTHLQAGDLPDLKPLGEVSQRMTQSVIRNPDALLWLSRVREHDDYTYRHALNTAVWALVVGRHLGLQEGLLNHLAMGCLLAHTGKVDLPAHLVSSEQTLDVADYQLFKTYPALGAEKLTAAGVSKIIVSIVLQHRERHNGTGFPEGLRGDRIPLLAKIAGLVNTYEELIEPREGRDPMSPAEAVSQLFEMRNMDFQEDLIEKFVQAIGIYPIGTLVELNSGQRGVVVSHSPETRLSPQVMMMTDQDHQPLRTAKILNLDSYNRNRSAEERLLIEHCLPFGTDNLHPGHYDVTGAEALWGKMKLPSW